jgi:hypothetical protein
VGGKLEVQVPGLSSINCTASIRAEAGGRRALQALASPLPCGRNRKEWPTGNLSCSVETRLNTEFIEHVNKEGAMVTQSDP